ncbi:DUF1533 domain-containing protein [Paenibacillus sp. LMG 31458]|uniref:DUF1533 domain-containing protein n=1 Tax=Paenibacillus phytorum TaxID=2654977 RepID=A0ABX1XYN0_9BACL|nr:DUF1533 domain-containing protein [Paenibacillus phytorum]NOU73693.1 DUF1533 domain-containing protein [Paenibacillus phytorum]
MARRISGSWDTSNNIVGQPIEVTFADDTAWRSTLRSLKVDGQTVSGAVYSLEAGKLTLSASLFPTAKNYSIILSADGYAYSTVIQTILPYSSKGHNKDDDTNDSSDFNNDDDE